MSMQDLSDAFAIIDANQGRWRAVGPRDPELITKAEAALGQRFPPTFREFVERYGAGSIGAFEVYGVTNDNFDTGRIPNGVWFTLDERRLGNLPGDLFIIGDAGDGDFYCLELRSGEVGRVVVHQLGIPFEKQKAEVVAIDFGEYFLTQLREEVDT